MTAPKLNVTMAYVDGRYYKVEDYPLDPWKDEIMELEDGTPDAFLKKGVVYRYETDVSRGLYPFRGELTEDMDREKAPVGIYYVKLSHSVYRIVIVRPRNATEAKEYSLNRAKNLAAAVMNGEYNPDNFVDSRLNPSDVGKDAYLPPIRTGDDFLNKIVKLAIRLKAAPLEPYGKRMAALAVDQRRSVEANNIKNNAVRRHRDNTAMSPSKALQDSDAWQLELVVGVRNAPDAMHRIQGIPDDGVLLIYPNGEPFDLKNATLINSDELLAQAIAETSDGIEGGRPLMGADAETNDGSEE